ncbi:hypothetical protein Clacol_004861 [Clathrus columnatus]|uniref:CCHC-type domain-containing protein n=1 Tax=Clathrus columnatus TaxID=1419009 RepID=A0AAV5A7P0_9AGAM|nr:hypothetical protein Clacol_004861 [Clathrus columnatus]
MNWTIKDWDAFVQKLANQFGSYTPEDDDENAIHDRSLRHIVKTAIPKCISSKLSTCGIATDTFDGMRQAVQKIDNEYWKAKQEEENRRKQLQQLQARLNKTVKGDPKTDKKNPPNSNTTTTTTSTMTSNNNNNNNNKKQPKNDKANIANNKTTTTSTLGAKPKHLGPNGRLTSTERERHVKEGLCLLCSTKGHLVKDCPKVTKTGDKSKAHTATAEAPKASTSGTKN